MYRYPGLIEWLIPALYGVLLFCVVRSPRLRQYPLFAAWSAVSVPLGIIWAGGLYSAWWTLEPLAILLTLGAAFEADRRLTVVLGPETRHHATWFGISLGILLGAIAWRAPYPGHFDERWLSLAYARQAVRIFCAFWIFGLAIGMWANELLSGSEHDRFALRHGALFGLLLFSGCLIDLWRVPDSRMVTLHRAYIAIQAVVISAWCLMFRSRLRGDRAADLPMN